MLDFFIWHPDSTNLLFEIFICAYFRINDRLISSDCPGSRPGFLLLRQAEWSVMKRI
jgi:hypothetical protein